LNAGDSLKLQPSGTPVRVRSLQSFGEQREHVEGGARVAVNLPGIDVHKIARGEMLVAPEFAAADAFTAHFTPIADALPILRRRNAVRVYIGSAEILGTLVLDEVPATESEVKAQLFLRRPTVAYPGTAFIARRLSPKNLLGGGRITERTAAEAPFEPATEPHETRVLAALRADAESALSASELARKANLREDAVEAALAALVERAEALRVLRPPAYIDMQAANALLGKVQQYLEAEQQREPWAMGVTSLALSRAIAVNEALLLRVLAAFAEEGRIAHRAGYFSTTDFSPKLTADQQAFFEEHVSIDPATPLLPVPLERVVSAVKQSRVAGIGKAFDTLLAKGMLVKVNEELYRGTQMAQIHARVETFLRANKQMTMAQFRDLIGTSRKYAVPLLEWFDARGITVRSGDYRMLRSKKETA
jgi:selenocysteine-specific elongation factor